MMVFLFPQDYNVLAQLLSIDMILRTMVFLFFLECAMALFGRVLPPAQWARLNLPHQATRDARSF